jgi:phosphoglucosamine mutase
MNNAPALTLRSITDDDMTVQKALMIGRMIGRSYGAVCIGSDTNPSSRMIKNSLISGLLSAGADVNDADLAPAPAVALASRSSDCMLMVGEPNEQGVVSKIYIMNSDGSVFTKEQLRQIIMIGKSDKPLPGYKNIGKLRFCDSVAEDYNRMVCEKHEGRIDAPVILDCGCGCTSLCAPQILASLGADLTTVNAQHDPRYCPRPPGVSAHDVNDLIEFVRVEQGSIGIALNGDGTRLALVDEKGSYIDPENILALLLIYLRPSSIVVPFNASAVIDDAFRGLIGNSVVTGAPVRGGRRIIRAENDLESITAAIKKNDAEMGALTDGAFIFPDVTLCPDAINAAVVLAKMSKDNSIRRLLASFPKYIVLKDSIYSPDNIEFFNRKLGEKLKEFDPEQVWEVSGGRVGMSGGWFAISRNAENPEYIDVIAEAKDRAYAVSMMELAKRIARESM